METKLHTENFRMLSSCKIQLATLYLSEEGLSPAMIMNWIVAGCAKMPPLDPNTVRFTLSHLVALKEEAKFLLSPSFDYAKTCSTKEQPLAYAPPQRRNSTGRAWRTIGTQTTAFELADWVQFQQFLKPNHDNSSDV